MNVIVLEFFCPRSSDYLLTIPWHNVKNLHKFDKQIDIVDNDVKEPKTFKLQVLFKGSKIKCPSGNFDDLFINYSPGLMQLYTYIKAYFG